MKTHKHVAKKKHIYNQIDKAQAHPQTSQKNFI